MDGSTQGYHMPAGEGDAWWFVDTRMTVKADGAATGGALTVIEWSAPVGFAPPLHVHPMEEEMLYLLSGSIRIVCGDREWDAGPGSFVLLPRGVPHGFIVTGDEPVRGLQLTTPAGFERFLADLGRRPAGPGLPPPAPLDIAHIVEVTARHNYLTVGPPVGSG